MMPGRGHIVLAAGGTGGHVIPAQALAEELLDRGHRLALITDDRGSRYAGWFDGVDSHVVPAGSFAGAGVATRIRAIGRIAAGIAASWRILRRLEPDAVVGFGGYPSLPVMAAAFLARIPSCVHEQNAVLGRVNRLLLASADALALSYRDTSGLRDKQHLRTIVTGNPVRRDVAKLFDRPYPPPEADGPVHAVVLGGSQGAAIMGTVVPAALAILPSSLRQRLRITQQCRSEDIDSVRDKYREIDVRAELAVYIDEIPERLAQAHFVIARAGASTVSEIAAAGRPAILVPLPGAADDHQTANARELDRAGGAWLVPQQDFTPAELARRIQDLLARPELLVAAAAHARGVARPRASAALADLVESLVRVRSPDSRHADNPHGGPADSNTDSSDLRRIAP